MCELTCVLPASCRRECLNVCSKDLENEKEKIRHLEKESGELDVKYVLQMQGQRANELNGGAER